MKYLALMSAIALTSAVGFTACSSSDEVSENKPVVDTKDFGKGVVTQFALNIGSASGTTRSTPDVAQQNNKFRGIQNVYLIPMDFAQTTTNTNVNFTNYVNNSDATVIQNDEADGYSKYETIIYHLGDITEKTSMEALGDDVYKRIYSLTLPVGTNNFLFYGRAKQEDTQSTDGFTSDKDALNGKLTMALAENTANAGAITFTLNAIEPTVDSGDDSPRTFLLNILNTVAQSYTGTAESPKYWSQLDNTKNKNKTLLQAYKNFTTIGGGELRAGSAEAIRATLQELYRTVLAQERYGEDEEVQNMAHAIRANLDTYFDVYFDEVESKTPFASGNLVAVDDINKKTPSTGTYTYDTYYYKPYLKYKSTDTNKINFPVPQGLPSGVVNLTFSTTTGSFSYNGNSTVVTSSGTATTNFTFPAELTYYANSALRASDLSKEAKDYPTNGMDWDNEDNDKWGEKTDGTNKDWKGTVVTADTRSVAMKNRVFYGVSQLKSTVNLGFASETSLKDNRKALLNDGKTDDQSIKINEKSFILTGILIGQQPDAAGWNFLPTSNSFNKVIYDRILPTGVNTYYTYPTFPEAAYSQADTGCNFVTTTGTAPNYTLVLDNYKTGDTQDEVSVALEFINNTGKDFYGRHNVIPAGGTFYLVGKLTIPGTTSINWATDYNVSKNNDYITRIPGYNTNRVFIQDHTTEANFTISEQALKRAYNTIPDLRTVQMLFGLSVDLEWRKGITYTSITLDE